MQDQWKPPHLRWSSKGGNPVMSAAVAAKPRERPSIARAVGFVALGWALVTLLLQVIIAAQSSSLPPTVHIFLPGYRAGQSTFMHWSPGALVLAGWTLSVALIVVALLGIVFASAARVWIAIVLVIVAALGSWLTVVYAGSALPQIGATDVSDSRLRSIVDPLAIVAIVAVFVTAFFGARLISYGRLGRIHA
jgi:hypothetical protein